MHVFLRAASSMHSRIAHVILMDHGVDITVGAGVIHHACHVCLLWLITIMRHHQGHTEYALPGQLAEGMTAAVRQHGRDNVQQKTSSLQADQQAYMWLAFFKGASIWLMAACSTSLFNILNSSGLLRGMTSIIGMKHTREPAAHFPAAFRMLHFTCFGDYIFVHQALV